MSPARVAALLAALLVLTIGRPAAAKVKPVTLAELAAAADAIAIVVVDRVETIDGRAVAHARVERPVRGLAKDDRIVFLAEPTWECDTSAARAGERALVLLADMPPEIEVHTSRPGRLTRAAVEAAVGAGVRPYVLAHAGRGRLPLVRRRAVDRVELPDGGITLPPRLPRRPRLDAVLEAVTAARAPAPGR